MGHDYIKDATIAMLRELGRNPDGDVYFELNHALGLVRKKAKALLEHTDPNTAATILEAGKLP